MGKHNMAAELSAMADALDRADRIGAPEDKPEGARYVRVSDTYAREWAARLRELAMMSLEG